MTVPNGLRDGPIFLDYNATTAPDLAASTGSACHEGIRGALPVLTAMGLPTERAAVPIVST